MDLPANGLELYIYRMVYGHLGGLWAGYCTGRLSNHLSMRLVDVILAPPSILLARAVVAISGPGKVLRVVMVLQ